MTARRISRRRMSGGNSRDFLVTIFVSSLLLLLLLVLPKGSTSFTPPSSRATPRSSKGSATRAETRTRTTTTTTRIHAKRNKRQQSKQDVEDLNRWYESVDASASPDDVFWQEMERQRLQNRLITNDNPNGDGVSAASPTTIPSSSGTDLMYSYPSYAAASSPSSSSLTPQQLQQQSFMSPSSSSTSSTMMSSQTSFSSSSSSSSSLSSSPSSSSRLQSQSPKLSTEATLNAYAAFAVADNWLDEELSWMLQDDDDDDENALFGRGGGGGFVNDESSLDQQIDEWEREDEEDDDSATRSVSWMSMSSDEPWDHWGESAQDRERNERPKIINKAGGGVNEFMLNTQEDDDEEEEALLLQEEELKRKEEADFVERLSRIRIVSPRLERARNSPKAAAFFEQEPDVVEGYDRCWVSAIDNACFKNLKGNLRNYGIQFLDNFGDWQDGDRLEDSFMSIEDIASFKARKVFEITGLPCIASRTSWEIEPIPNYNTGSSSSTSPGSRMMGGAGATATISPRVASGYRFNDVGVHVDYICDALRPLSEPSRVTQFKTCLCYYDGEMEVYDYGVAEVDLIFCNSLRTFIPVSQAINEMVKTLELTFGIEYQPWIKKRVDSDDEASFDSASVVRLRDRVLKDGRVLPNDIIDVSSFMDSKVDVDLMDECAKELSNRFMKYKPNKVITVATTGLVIALPIAKYLQVPLVYARKERSIVMADTYKAAYSSKTVGKNRELLVSKSHLDEEDRVLVVDDFLSSGASQEALLRIVAESGATAVGVGVLLEKVYDSGRQSLSGFNVPVHSLCRIASLQNGVIQLIEEEGYDRMKKKTSHNDSQ